MDPTDEGERAFVPPIQRFQPSAILRLLLGIFWRLLHLLVSLVHLGSYLLLLLHCCCISSGILKRYKKIQLNKLQYLAVVVDSEEAKNTIKIKQLLCWLSALGVKYVILYDIEGVLKKSLETYLKDFRNPTKITFSDADANTNTSLYQQQRMKTEFLSSTDGKEAVAKAASFLCSKYLKDASAMCNKTGPIFTETDVSNALKAVGYGGPEPDLLLVYGPARCHLGFPAWRMRYTEIVHMGPLRSMKQSAIVKAFYEFSKKHQNYGT